jgi:uncharacterized protein (DUF697 family)
MARLHPLTVLSLVRELKAAAENQGPLCVDGAPALADALRKELMHGGDPPAVRAGLSPDAEALVYVLAEAATDADERTLAAAHRARVPIVAVLAGPELEPHVPFVLATDIVRVPAASGFPVDEIARALAHRLGERGTSLAARLPVLRDAVCRELIESVSRKAGLIGAAVWVPGADMPAITIAQLRLVLRIAAAHGVEVGQERVPEVVAVVGGGFGFRAVARRLLARMPVPGWGIRAAVAYAGTRAIGEAALRLYGERGAKPKVASE